MAKKVRKRSNGEGTIVPKANGSWEARILITDPITGESKIRTRCRKTKAEVKAWLDDIKVKLHTGQYVGEQKMTVREWLNTWLNLYAMKKIRRTTFESYESIIKTHIIPSIGNIRLQSLRKDQIQKFYNDKQENGRADGKGGLSSTTINYMHAILKQALQQAVDDGLVYKNIATSVVKPSKVRFHPQTLNTEQVKKFLQSNKGSKYYSAFLVECYTGLRRGELLGLRWKDIDLEGKLLSVQQGLVRTKNGLSINEPKTTASRRTIPLTDEVVQELKQHRKRQLEERLLTGSSYYDLDLVFSSHIGKPLDPRSFTKRFQEGLRVAGLPEIRFHDMRHTHATILLEMKQNVKVIQERLGHTTIRMTLDTYSHMLPGMQEQATEAGNRGIKQGVRNIRLGKELACCASSFCI